MGQYHLVVNLDKKELLHPHAFGDGLKMMEFGQSSGGTLLGLTVLLACSHDRGGGDLHYEPTPLHKAILGRWAGDRIAIVGDYAEAEDYPGLTKKTIEDIWNGNSEYMNISYYVIKVLGNEFQGKIPDMPKIRFIEETGKFEQL